MKFDSDIYIIGPMSNIENLNRPAFEEARRKLINAGYKKVTIPHDLTFDDAPWHEGMWNSVAYALRMADKVAILDGDVSNSKGTLIEINVCKDTHKPIGRVSDWLKIGTNL